MAKTIKIGGRLESVETGNIVAGANQIIDDAKNKRQSVINSEVDAELVRLDETKQGILTFDNAPTEDSNNPVKSGGVYAADKLLSDAIEAILLLIPSAASALNKLVDMQTMNSSIATATATFRGTYNVVSDLELAYNATHEQIAAKLDEVIATADNNDYAFVQIPVSATSQDIAKTERYKFNGEAWAYEYDLNNSGFTQAQWDAINSTITAALVSKLRALPTATELQTALNGKQDNLTFDQTPTSGSQNPVTSGGVYSRNAEIVALITALDTAKQDVLTFDSTPTQNSSNPVTSNGVYVAVSALQAAIVALDAAKQNVLTFDSTPTLGSNNPVTSSGIKTEANRLNGLISDNAAAIVTLNNLYQALTQSALVVVAPTDTWPVASPDATTIYRVVDRVNTPPQYYSDYMFRGSTPVLMAQYDNAIDNDPTYGSDNLVKSGGVFDKVVEIGKVIDIDTLNERYSYVDNKRIPLSGNIGDTVDVTAESGNTSFCYVKIPVKSGDSYYLRGYGGASSRLWAFVSEDSANAVIQQIAPADTENNYYQKLTAAADGVLVCNFRKDLAPYDVFKSLAKYKDIEGVVNLANAEPVWQNGYIIDSSGNATASTNFRVGYLEVVKASYVRLNAQAGSVGYYVFTLDDGTKQIGRVQNSEGNLYTLTVPTKAISFAFTDTIANNSKVIFVFGETNDYKGIVDSDKLFLADIPSWKSGYINNSGEIVDYETAVHAIIPAIGTSYMITNIQGYNASYYWFFKADGTAVLSDRRNVNQYGSQSSYLPLHVVKVPEGTVAIGISSKVTPTQDMFVKLLPNVDNEVIGGVVSMIDSFTWQEGRYFGRYYDGEIRDNESEETIDKTTIDVSGGSYIIGKFRTGSIGVIMWLMDDNSTQIGDYYGDDTLKCIPIPEGAKELSFGQVYPENLDAVYIIKANKNDKKTIAQKVFENKANSLYFNKGAAEKDSQKPIGIFVGGQSNAAGFTPHDDMPSYLVNSFPINNCLKDINLTGDSVITPAAFTAFTDPWGWGFDTELVYDICVRDSIDLKFVKRAKGSTPISYLYGTENGRWSADYEGLTGTQYSLIRQAEQMIKFHKDSAWDYRAIVWHQGEADRRDPLNYYRNLKNLISYLRGVIGNSELPFITGSIPELSSSYYPEFDEAYERICAEDKNVHIIDMSGASLRDDNHFSAESCIYLGDMIHDKMVDLGIISATKINPTRPW